jgi:hypothetical protein
MSLLAGHQNVKVEQDPFPHAVIRSAFPEQLYEQLSREFPGIDTFTRGHRHPDSTKIYRIAPDLIADSEVSPTWRKTIEEHIDREHFLLQYALFREHLLDLCPEFENRFGRPEEMRVGFEVVDDFREHDLLLNATLTVHTPNRGGPATDRGPHIKVANKPILGHLMFPIENDCTTGGGLELFAWPRSEVPLVGHHNVLKSATDLTPTKLIPYERNTLVLFLNAPWSVQSWAVRGISPHPLRYLHFVSEVREPLFELRMTPGAVLRSRLRRAINSVVPKVQN